MNAVKRRTNNGTKRKHFWRKSGAGFTLIELLIVAAIFSLTALLATTIFSNVQSTQRAISSQQRVTTDGRYVLETIAQNVRTGTLNYSIYNHVGSAPNQDYRWPPEVPHDENKDAGGNVIGSLSRPDYVQGEVDNPEDVLSTIDQLGVVSCFKLNSETSKVEVLTPAETDCPESPENGSAWTPFTPDDIEVETFNFFITPMSDPFRPIPRTDEECKVSTTGDPITAGFDSAKGACVCPNINSCYFGQKCMSTIRLGRECNSLEPPQDDYTENGLGSEQNCICQNPNWQPQVTIFLKSHSTSGGSGERAEATLQTTVVSRVYQR